MTASTLLCTAGTSLLRNREHMDLKQIVGEVEQLDWSDRAVGAELNALDALQKGGYVDADCRVHYFLTTTEQGQLVGQVLQKVIGADRVVLHHVKDLDPADPDRFARKGLAQLAQEQCRVLARLDPCYCALDTTGGLKAQTGIAVSLGQALQIPVYYRHESFNRIIALPPLPVALDVELWCRNAELFFELSDDLTIIADLPKDPRVLGLLEWTLEQEQYLVGLNATGRIFHEVLRQRWSEISLRLLPKPAPKKQVVKLPDHGWPDRQRLMDTMQRLVERVPYISRCYSAYLNPNLPKKSTFILKQGCLYGLCSDGTYTAGFAIKTTGSNQAQLEACLADLLEKLEHDGAAEWLW